jgi:hypothetical protein
VTSEFTKCELKKNRGNLPSSRCFGISTFFLEKEGERK